MKICAISDLHRYQIDIPKCNVLAIAGDICLNEDLLWFITSFVPYLEQQKNKFDICILVFGNHDDNIHMNARWNNIEKNLPEYIKVLNNTSFKYKGVKFYGSPNCKHIPGFLNTFNEETLKHIYSSMPSDTDILVTHTPPYGICDTVKYQSYHLGSVSLLEKVREIKPEIHIFGHIHTGKKYYKENGTQYYNVSILDENYKLAYKPTIINYRRTT